MNKWKIIIIFFFCLACSQATFAKIQKKTATNYNKNSLISEINQILQSVEGRPAVGIYVKSMKNGDTLYAKNAQALFTPASIIKILTAEAALLYLGTEYKFPTRLLTDAKTFRTESGIINGNLYLVQSGDPTLTYYDLNDFIVALKAQQIQGVTGNVYIDNTAYDEEHFGPGWLWEDKQYCFAAPISASIINHNCLIFKVAPAKQSGQRASIIPNPRYYYGYIQNSVMTKNAGAKSCYVQLENPSPKMAISGCIPKGHTAWGISTVIENITEYNKHLLQNLFHYYGIRVAGDIKVGVVNKKAFSIATHESKPLHILINDMLKKSDNIIAGSLLKKMGELYSSQPGSWENGELAIKTILAKKAGIDVSGLNITDGSGLSPDNQLKPAQMMQVLDFAYHHYATNYEFISALPISGKDGTLKNRLRNVAQKVRAKTGTLSSLGVVSLAGYVVTQDKEPLAFVIIINGQNGYGWKYREIEDKIVTVLTKYSQR